MLKEGILVVYKRTGTYGKVVELKEMEGKVWAMLDSTGLFYDEDFLEVIGEDKTSQSEPRVNVKDKKIRSEGPEVEEEGKIDTSGNVCGAG